MVGHSSRGEGREKDTIHAVYTYYCENCPYRDPVERASYYAFSRTLESLSFLRHIVRSFVVVRLHFNNLGFAGANEFVRPPATLCQH